MVIPSEPVDIIVMPCFTNVNSHPLSDVENNLSDTESPNSPAEILNQPQLAETAGTNQFSSLPPLAPSYQYIHPSNQTAISPQLPVQLKAPTQISVSPQAHFAGQHGQADPSQPGPSNANSVPFQPGTMALLPNQLLTQDQFFFMLQQNTMSYSNIVAAAQQGNLNAINLLKSLGGFAQNSNPWLPSTHFQGPQPSNNVYANTMSVGGPAPAFPSSPTNVFNISQSNEQNIDQSQIQLTIQHTANERRRDTEIQDLESKLEEIASGEPLFGLSTAFDWWNGVVLFGGVVLVTSLFFINSPKRRESKVQEKEIRKQGYEEGYKQYQSTLAETGKFERKKSFWRRLSKTLQVQQTYRQLAQLAGLMGWKKGQCKQNGITT